MKSPVRTDRLFTAAFVIAAAVFTTGCRSTMPVARSGESIEQVVRCTTVDPYVGWGAPLSGTGRACLVQRTRAAPTAQAISISATGMPTQGETVVGAADDVPGGPHGIPETHDSQAGRLFPLFGKEVRSRGHDLPYPGGAGGGYFYTERRMEITKLDVALGGTPIDVSSVTVDPYSKAEAWEIKADLWVLPFLNLYGFYGRLNTDTETTVTIPNPTPGGSDISFALPTKLDGETAGIGVVIAGGYKSWFASVNSNYSMTELGFDDKIEANVNTLRLGRHTKLGRFEVGLWTGMSYWNLEKQVAGTISVPGAGDITFEVHYRPAQPFNAILGTHVTYKKRFELVVEWGFWDEVTTLAIHGGIRI